MAPWPLILFFLEGGRAVFQKIPSLASIHLGLKVVHFSNIPLIIQLCWLFRSSTFDNGPDTTRWRRHTQRPSRKQRKGRARTPGCKPPQVVKFCRDFQFKLFVFPNSSSFAIRHCSQPKNTISLKYLATWAVERFQAHRQKCEVDFLQTPVCTVLTRTTVDPWPCDPSFRWNPFLCQSF